MKLLVGLYFDSSISRSATRVSSWDTYLKPQLGSSASAIKPLGQTHSRRNISLGVRSRYTQVDFEFRQLRQVGSLEAPGGAGVHFAFRSLHLTQAIAPRRGVSDRFLVFADGSAGILPSLTRAIRFCSDKADGEIDVSRVNKRMATKVVVFLGSLGQGGLA